MVYTDGRQTLISTTYPTNCIHNIHDNDSILFVRNCIYLLSTLPAAMYVLIPRVRL